MFQYLECAIRQRWPVVKTATGWGIYSWRSKMSLLRVLGIVAAVIMMVYFATKNPNIILLVVVVWFIYEIACFIYQEGEDEGRW
jgi:hypothetical protein